MKPKRAGRQFAVMAKIDVPQGRNGKHKTVVTAILENLDHLDKGDALRISLKELDDSKANIRSALNRETRKQKRNVATAADGQYLYIWNVAD